MNENKFVENLKRQYFRKKDNMYSGFKKEYRSKKIAAWTLSEGDWFRMFGDIYRVTSVEPALLSEGTKLHIVATRATGDPGARYAVFLPRLAKIKVWRSKDGVR